ncbi:MAG TPA: zinc-binding dehydrogenase [Bordetella sp.]
MPDKIPDRALQLRSLITSKGELEVSLSLADVPRPAADQVIVRIEASPINPSDIGLLFGPADITQARLEGTADTPVLKAPVAQAALGGIGGRLGQSLPVGNEGAGVVVAAGDSPDAQALLGKMVSVAGGGLYAQYCLKNADDCLVLPPGTSAAAGASAFINPLTALGMLETMRREGHTALVHTAAASNLGQMLQNACLKDGIGLVNIVRSPEQADLLRQRGAVHVCDTSQASFMADLTDALEATGATIAFDAIGGGKLAGQILLAMEAAINRRGLPYSRYGSDVHKQVYVYGGLNAGLVEIDRSAGMAWAVGGWLLYHFLKKIGREQTQWLRQRVASEIASTFKSAYAGNISLSEMVQPEIVAKYYKRATGEKYLVTPNA